MTTEVSENISQKPKRGRPRNQWLASSVAIAKGHGCLVDIHTDRHAQNIAYRQEAVCVLSNHPERHKWTWIIDREACQRGDKRPWKSTILMELGRISDPDQMIEVARQLSNIDPHPTAREAVAMIRRWRLGTQPAADPHQLSVTIGNTVQRYIDTHRDVDKDTVLAALEHVVKTVKSMDW
jgi:hypothetical protein